MERGIKGPRDYGTKGLRDQGAEGLRDRGAERQRERRIMARRAEGRRGAGDVKEVSAQKVAATSEWEAEGSGKCDQRRALLGAAGISTAATVAVIDGAGRLQRGGNKRQNSSRD